MSVNLSFIKLNGKVVQNYNKTLKNWKNKDVNFDDLHKVVGNSKIQFSCYAWRNGAKTPVNFNIDKTNCIILDIDSGMSISKFQSMFKKYKYILATTKSHQQEKKGLITDRFRVLIPTINISSNADVHFRALSLIAPFSDEQVLTKTASFLGTDDCIIIRNDGKKFDMFKANELAESQLNDEKRIKEAKKLDKDLINDSYGGNTLEIIKEQLDMHIVKEILESVEFKAIGNKVALRDERTPSTKIYNDGGMYDYGSGKAYDIFQVLVDYRDMSFREAMVYVKQFI